MSCRLRRPCSIKKRKSSNRVMIMTLNPRNSPQGKQDKRQKRVYRNKNKRETRQNHTNIDHEVVGSRRTS